MNVLPAEAQLIMITLAASLAVGLPVRLVGVSGTLNGISLVFAFLRRRKFAILGLGLIGALGGLWSFETVRELAGHLLLPG